MASIHDEPAPGTTLKNLIEQDAFLRELVDMMRRRFELDKQYTESLRELRASVNPKWAESAVQQVASPFITLLDTEINLRENTTNTLFTTLDEIHPSRPLDESDEDGLIPVTKYEELQISYEEYLVKLREVNTEESIASLQAWYQRPRVARAIENMTANDIEAYIFPEVDRKYRESVANQHRISETCLIWHKNYLPRCLDTHQQFIEDIKSTLNSVAMNYSQLASQLVQASAAMTDTVSNISSSRYIAPLHLSQEREVEHPLIQPVVYRNFYTDGHAAQPVFGLPLSEDYVSSLPEHYDWTSYWRPLSVDQIFELEKTAPEVSRIQDYVNREGGDLTQHYIVASFFTIPPFMHLRTEILAKYSDRWTRSKLEAPMRTISTLAKRHLDQTLSHLGQDLFRYLYVQRRQSAALWCHNREAKDFLTALYRKWDFENDCPLPGGVVRQGPEYGEPFVGHKKRGSLYSPT